MAVFLSHSSKDGKFVRLLAKLLDFHGIEYWYSAKNLIGGDRFAPKIATAVSKADTMLLVLSENAVVSDWVAHEVRLFREIRPNGRIIPLILSDLEEEKLKGLNIDEFQYVRFSDCLLTGFELLFNSFGIRFLSRPVVPRGKDRRKAPTLQRMRMGFWKSYEQTMSHGRFEQVKLTVDDLRRIAEGLKKEVQHYTFYKRRQNESERREPVDIEPELYPTVREVYNDYRDSRSRAVLIAEGIAELLWENYEVVQKDRRENSSSTLGSTS